MPYFKNKILIGSAQFGLDYGIANKNGKVAQEEVIKLIGQMIKRNTLRSLLKTPLCHQGFKRLN